MLALLLLCQFVSADVTLKVRPQALVPAGQAVTLDLLVDGAGLSEDVRAKLGRTPVGEPLASDERRRLSPAELVPLLREAVKGFSDQGRLHLDLPPKIEIATRARGLNRADVTDDLLAKWKASCTDCQLSIENLSLPRVDRVRDFQIESKTDLPRGSFSLPVEITRENGTVVPGWIGGRLVVKKRAPVARRSLALNETVNASDLDWEYRDLSQSYDGVPRVAELEGKHLRQALRAGEVLYAGLLEKEKAVHRGQTVQVKTGEGDWEVTTNAVAQADASLGDWIALRGAKNGNALEGQVTAPGEVRLK